MNLKPKESEELKFVQIQKSKHGRNIDGKRVVDADAVNGDYAPPGAAMGQITDNGLYGPVTRAAVGSGGANTTDNTIPYVLSDDDFDNFQVGDEIICDPGESGEETATITEIDRDNQVITTDGITTEHAENVVIQKNDGSSTAKFICLELVEVSDGDAIVGGITHGAVYSGRMPNFDSIVADDLPMISFE